MSAAVVTFKTGFTARLMDYDSEEQCASACAFLGMESYLHLVCRALSVTPRMPSENLSSDGAQCHEEQIDKLGVPCRYGLADIFRH